jgi:dipeptidyl aminopeptidase/acylaminoacyl peptidase
MEVPSGLFDALTRDGFVVLAPAYFARTPAPGPNPRDFGEAGASGPPEAVTEAAQVWQQVISDGVTFLQGHPHVDQKKVAVVGHSLGAIMALRAASDDPRLKAVVEIAAPVDIPAFPAFSRLMDDFADRAKRLPIVLILHGDEDATVPITQAVTIRQTMVQLGQRVEYQAIVGGDHLLRGRVGQSGVTYIQFFLNTWLRL